MASNKTILITGSEGNVGSAIAKYFSSNGWKTIGIDIKERDEAKTWNTDFYLKCDVRDRERLKKIVEELETIGTEVTALFTAAGIDLEKNFEDTSMDEWKLLLDTVLGGSTNACEAVAPFMAKRKSGKIIILSPDYRNLEGDYIMQATASGTLHGFAKSFGTEMAEDNVMVNALYPNVPFDLEATAATAFYLADKDNYTTAQVVSINGE